jgi:hypothetical protein
MGQLWEERRDDDQAEHYRIGSDDVSDVVYRRVLRIVVHWFLWLTRLHSARMRTLRGRWRF